MRFSPCVTEIVAEAAKSLKASMHRKHSCFKATHKALSVALVNFILNSLLPDRVNHGVLASSAAATPRITPPFWSRSTPHTLDAGRIGATLMLRDRKLLLAVRKCDSYHRQKTPTTPAAINRAVRLI